VPDDYKNEIDKLKASLTAHVEAYELQAEAYREFSVALSQINELLRGVDDHVVDVKDLTKESLRSLIDSVVMIGKQLHGLISATHVTDKHLMSRVDDLLRFVVEMGKLTELKEDQINELLRQVAHLERKVSDKLSEFDKLAQAILAGQKVIEARLAENRDKEWRKTVVKIWIAALFFIITVIGAFMQIGLFKWVWAPQ
jgi:chromosome segregation ATPase